MKKYYFVTMQERKYKNHILDDCYIEHYQGIESIWFWQSPKKLYNKLQNRCGFNKNIKIESL